jgi:GntR family transcriptional regulator, transcriptional repressor for pyruvate dehydrogenase complex
MRARPVSAARSKSASVSTPVLAPTLTKTSASKPKPKVAAASTPPLASAPTPPPAAPATTRPARPEFARLRGARVRVSDDIAARIRTEIENGTLTAGSRLPAERTLSEQLGVSRNALREALRSLENAGLIRLHKGVHGGAVVQSANGQVVGSGLLDMYHLGGIEPRHLTQARIHYESIIIRLACDKATPADITALNANIEAAEAARRAGRFNERIDLHIEFHRMLARLAGNPIMVAVMNGVLDIMVRFLHTLGPYDNTAVTPSRRRFMQHFAAREVDAAVAEMDSLLRRLEEHYLSRVGVLQPQAAPPPHAQQTAQARQTRSQFSGG